MGQATGGRGRAFQPEAAADAWARTLAFLSVHLRRAQGRQEVERRERGPVDSPVRAGRAVHDARLAYVLWPTQMVERMRQRRPSQQPPGISPQFRRFIGVSEWLAAAGLILVERAPFFDGYQKRTSRELPMVILRPR